MYCVEYGALFILLGPNCVWIGGLRSLAALWNLFEWLVGIGVDLKAMKNGKLKRRLAS